MKNPEGGTDKPLGFSCFRRGRRLAGRETIKAWLWPPHGRGYAHAPLSMRLAHGNLGFDAQDNFQAPAVAAAAAGVEAAAVRGSVEADSEAVGYNGQILCI